MMNAGGEIRSQLAHSTKHLYFDSKINGAQEVPAVTTMAMGVGSLWLNATMDTMWYDVVADGLSGAITGAHIHEATAGNNGAVVHNMTTDINIIIIMFLHSLGEHLGPSLGSPGESLGATGLARGLHRST